MVKPSAGFSITHAVLPRYGSSRVVEEIRAVVEWDHTRRSWGRWMLGAAALLGPNAEAYQFSIKSAPSARENFIQWADVLRLISSGKREEARQAQLKAAQGTEAIRRQGDTAWADQMEAFFPRYIDLWIKKPPYSMILSFQFANGRKNYKRPCLRF